MTYTGNLINSTKLLKTFEKNNDWNFPFIVTSDKYTYKFIWQIHGLCVCMYICVYIIDWHKQFPGLNLTLNTQHTVTLYSVRLVIFPFVLCVHSVGVNLLFQCTRH